MSWLTAKLLNYFLAAAAIGALFGWGITALAMRSTINSLSASINQPKTGYIARISSLSSDLAMCRGTNAVLESAVDTQNQAVEQYQKLSKLVVEQGVSRLKDIQTRLPSVRAEVKRIENVKRTGDDCSDAKAVLQEIIK